MGQGHVATYYLLFLLGYLILTTYPSPLITHKGGKRNSRGAARVSTDY